MERGVQHGDHNTQYNVWSDTPARSEYHRLVATLCPDVLRDRDAELAELAAFCAGPPGYRCYRAPAWAGKTGLVAWFARQPPEGVRVVPFFVNGRDAAQGTRTAFLDVVIEQLAELLGRSTPVLAEATRTGHLWALLEEAAHVCSARGERLVLLVDGLDEDLGVPAGADPTSIAALLPARPLDLHVLVTSRPHPPLPDDVPADHPLRDPSVARDLAGSRHAGLRQVVSENEVKRLLGGSDLERDLLGTIVVARGGLTAENLAELTDEPPWRVRAHLTASRGRTFTARVSRWHPSASHYALAHDGLHVLTENLLGRKALDAYRDRLHTWADRYRDWPADTPEYLLDGYARVLLASGDLPRLVALATHRTRQERLLELTGSDTAALTELAAIMTAAEDLPDLARLAVHRDELVQRNIAVPLELPALWAELGEVRRAVSLALGITDPDRRTAAVGELARVLRKSGDGALAELTDHVSPALRAQLELSTVDSDGNLTEPLAVRMSRPTWNGSLGAVIRGLVDEGRLDEAEDTARHMVASWTPSVSLAWISFARSASGDRTRALALAREAAAEAPTSEQATTAARAAVAAGDRDRTAAEALDRTTRPMAHRPADDQAAALAARWAELGDVDRAVAWLSEVVGTTPAQYPRTAVRRALVAIARHDPERALSALRRVSEPMNRSWLLDDLVVGAPDLDVAERFALAGKRHERSTRLADVVAAAVEAGDLTRATRVAELITAAFPAARAAGMIAGGHAAQGDFGPAEELADRIPDPHRRGEALLIAAKALIAQGETRRAAPLLEAADAAAAQLDDEARDWLRFRVLRVVAGAAGDEAQTERLIRRAEELANEFGESSFEYYVTGGEAMLHLVEADLAENRVGRARHRASGIKSSLDRRLALTAVVTALIAAGNLNNAAFLTHQVPSARPAVAAALVTVGFTDEAEDLAHNAETWTAMARVAPARLTAHYTRRALRAGGWVDAVDALPVEALAALTTELGDRSRPVRL
ncbi:hypothetical protein [Actinosynnema sp. NPDC020468]|uniref:hypothetical protein n=1 Tax=Actinosynnema sp. NPDC020468 TaxID=3154488 RepID=UPI0033C9CA09